MKIFYFTLFMFKRYLKTPSFAAILVLVPLCCLGLRAAGFGEDIKINAAIYSESGVDLEPLLSYEGAVRFTVFDTLEEMEAAVTSKKAECGYFLTESLPAVYDSDALRGSIICYKSPSTAFDKVVNEIVFAELFKGYAYDIGSELAAEAGYNDEEAFDAAYNRFLNEDAVISLSYEYIEDTAMADNVTAFSYLKGIFGIFIMIGGLLGAFRAGKDEKAGLFKTLPTYKRALLSYSYFITPALLCALSALVGFWLSGAFSPLAELLGTVIFALVAAAFGAFVYGLLPDVRAFGAVLAFLPLICLIFCPIFTDISALIEPAEVIRRLLIPTYYMQNRLFIPLIITLLLSFGAMVLRFSRPNP